MQYKDLRNFIDEAVNGLPIPDIIGTEFVSVIVSFETGRTVEPKRLRKLIRSNGTNVGSGNRYQFKSKTESGQYTETIKKIIGFVLADTGSNRTENRIKTKSERTTELTELK